MTYNHALMAAIDNNNVNDFWNILYNDDAFVSKDIAYDPEWANGTGYYDGAVKADMAELGVGQVGRSRSPAPNNRRILIVKTRYGNVVVFERMTPAEDGTLKGPITINMPDMIRHTELIGTEGPLTIDQLVSIFGNGVQPVYNVGVRLEHLLTYMNGRGERPVIVFNPLYPTIYAALERYGNPVTAWSLDYLRRLRARYDFVVVDCENIGTWGGTMTDWKNPGHVDQLNMRRMLRYVVAHSDGAL